MANESALVSVLIPAYNRPDYLELALQSVLFQTYKNIEIIICDDSSTTGVQEMIRRYMKDFPQIHYYKNDSNLFMKNYDKCFSLAKGKYINFLMDDDLFLSRKIEMMVKELEENPEVKLVTSTKYAIDEHGNPLDPPILPKFKWMKKNQTIAGIKLGNYALKYHTNCVGEPTTVMFRRNDIPEFRRFMEREYTYLSDLATWLTLLSEGKAVILGEPLSYFRLHPKQMQKRLSVLLPGMKEWFRLIRDSRKVGFLKKVRDYRIALKRLFFHCCRMIRRARSLGLSRSEIQKLNKLKRKIKKEINHAK